jgi:4'-phosphopantetheinyl transferase
MFTPFEAPVDGEVAVFCAAIPQALYDRDVFEWLSAEDASIAAGMRSPRRRAQFAAGRWLLRHAAARVFGEGGYTLRTVAGRPLVAASDGWPAAASVAHSAGMVLCAAARVPALGVDVERIRPRRGWPALSALVLHPRERAGLDEAVEAVRWIRFYRAWTYKEALAKALGIGVFSLSLERIHVGDGVLREAPAEEVPHLRDWKLRELAVGEGLAAAVAWRT